MSINSKDQQSSLPNDSWLKYYPLSKLRTNPFYAKFTAEQRTIQQLQIKDDNPVQKSDDNDSTESSGMESTEVLMDVKHRHEQVKRKHKEAWLHS